MGEVEKIRTYFVRYRAFLIDGGQVEVAGCWVLRKLSIMNSLL